VIQRTLRFTRIFMLANTVLCMLLITWVSMLSIAEVKPL
jgi:hypothetical protein